MMPFLFIGMGWGCASGRLPKAFAGVALRGYLRAPRPVREVPVDGPRKAARKRLERAPAELPPQLRAVDRVPAVVPGPVRDILDLAGVGLAVLAGGRGVEEGAESPS